MDWLEIQQQWPRYRQQVRRQWSALTENDMDLIAGSQDRLIERIQQQYGISPEQARQQVDEFLLATSADGRAVRLRTLLFNEEIRGVKVIAADGRSVGEVGDLLVETTTWQVNSVEIKLEKEVAEELGVPRGRFHAATVGVPVRMIQSVGDNVLLTVTADGLRPTLRAHKDAA